jgi:hypothetical protein
MPMSSWMLLCLVAAGCARPPSGTDAGESSPPAPSVDAAQTDIGTAPTRTLTIRWQRLIVDGGGTCPRCAGTEDAIREAERTLRPALSPLGIRVAVEEGELDMASFQGNPSESNRIWIDGRSLEEILGAAAGSSQCCGACGDNECRTLVLDGRTYEAVPATLIVRAALKAAADLLDPAAGDLGPAPVEPPAPGGSCGCGAAPASRAPQLPAPGGSSCCGAAPPAPTPCCGG